MSGGSLRVLHLTGSPTSREFSDLSLLYARGCLEAIGEDERFHHRVVHVAPDGGWRFTRSLAEGDLTGADGLGAGDAMQRICDLEPDVMVPHLFCVAGMTHYRAVFDVLGIPYVGNRPEVMALAARKDLARGVMAAAGVPVPEAELVGLGETPALEPPVVVKPAGADNSAGVSLVRDRGEYGEAIAGARRHGPRVLVERFVEPGREVRCGIVERGGELVALPLEEYPVDAERPIRRTVDKLARDETGELRLVAKDPSGAWLVDADDPITGVVQDLARRCHLALDCRHHSLFDFRVDSRGQPWFLEASLYCSFSPQSVIVTMAAAAGIELRELFASSVGAALGAPAPAERGAAPGSGASEDEASA